MTKIVHRMSTLMDETFFAALTLNKRETLGELPFTDRNERLVLISVHTGCCDAVTATYCLCSGENPEGRQSQNGEFGCFLFGYFQVVHGKYA